MYSLTQTTTPPKQRKDRFHSRECLIPHRNNRLRFEGVLISVTKPSEKTGHMYNLTFASVNAIHHRDVEIDHVIIEMRPAVYDIIRNKCPLFKRIQFTAKVVAYQSIGRILDQPAQTQEMGLADMNPHRIEAHTSSVKTQPTLFTRNRIDVLASGEANKELRSELYARAIREPNDGTVEQFLEEMNREKRERTVKHTDVINVVYRRRR